jgi:hypothetical protein
VLVEGNNNNNKSKSKSSIITIFSETLVVWVTTLMEQFNFSLAQDLDIDVLCLYFNPNKVLDAVRKVLTEKMMFILTAKVSLKTAVMTIIININQI